MPFCNVFAISDKYDRSVEEYLSEAKDGQKFVIERTLVGWNIAPYKEPVQPTVEEKPPVVKPGNEEKKDAKQGIPRTGSKTPRRRGGISQRSNRQQD